MTTAEALARGRECFARRAWADAFAELSAADREAPLEPEDLERLAAAAYLIGSDEDSVEAWERAHRELLSRGDVVRARADDCVSSVATARWSPIGALVPRRKQESTSDIVEAQCR